MTLRRKRAVRREAEYNNDLVPSAETVNGGSRVAFGYDRDGLLTTSGALTIERDADNALVRGTTIGSIEEAYTPDADGSTLSYAATRSTTRLLGFTYSRDTAGRINAIAETIAGSTTNYSYEYDPVGRLTRVKAGTAVIAEYDYEPNGNRIAHRYPGGSDSATYDAVDRLQTYGSSSYTYAIDGTLRTRTVAGATTTFTYDKLGNLRSVDLPGRNIEYVIDAHHRRIGKKIGGALAQAFVYSDSLHIAAELDGTGAVVSRFVYGTRTNVPSYMIRGGVTYAILADHLGSPRLVVNASTGEIAQRLDYDPFGRILSDTNPGFQPFAFAGGLYDRDTNLIRFGARDYDP
jgi:YD repeat-containing protein